MPSQSTDPLINALRKLAQSSPHLKPAAHVYEIILPILRDADPSTGSGQLLRVDSIEMPAEYAREKLGRGIPLLREEGKDDPVNRLPVDPGAVRDLLIRLAQELESPRSPLKGGRRGDHPAKPIRAALERNQIDVAALLPHLFANDRAYVDALAREGKDDSPNRLTFDPGFFWTLAQNAVKPAYRAWAQQFGPVLRGTEWERAECFVCGDIATLAELQGNDQERHLRCGRCGTDWEYRRLRCIYCGSEDPKKLGTLFADESRRSVYAQTCDDCKGYVKMIAAFSPNPTEMLVVHDLETLSLDFIAQKNGYTRDAIRSKEVNAGDRRNNPSTRE